MKFAVKIEKLRYLINDLLKAEKYFVFAQKQARRRQVKRAIMPNIIRTRHTHKNVHNYRIVNKVSVGDYVKMLNNGWIGIFCASW